MNSAVYTKASALSQQHYLLYVAKNYARLPRRCLIRPQLQQLLSHGREQVPSNKALRCRSITSPSAVEFQSFCGSCKSIRFNRLLKCQSLNQTELLQLQDYRVAPTGRKRKLPKALGNLFVTYPYLCQRQEELFSIALNVKAKRSNAVSLQCWAFSNNSVSILSCLFLRPNFAMLPGNVKVRFCGAIGQAMQSAATALGRTENFIISSIG